MSKFFTPIPVDVARIKALLPKDVYLEGIKWNDKESRVEVYWDSNEFRSPWTIPFLLDEYALRSGELPDKVIKSGPRQPKAQVEVAKPQVKTPKRTKKSLM